LKAEVEARIQEMIQKQIGSSTPVKIDVEKQPQFQEEWRRVSSDLDAQYEKALEEHRQQIIGLA